MDSHSKFVPASSLSIADLQDMVNKVHLPSSSASNTALSTISGTSPTWLLGSTCYNHMTSSPDVVPSHTSTPLPFLHRVGHVTLLFLWMIFPDILRFISSKIVLNFIKYIVTLPK